MSSIVLLTTDKPLSRTVAHALQQRFGDVNSIVIQRKSLITSVAQRVRQVGLRRAVGQFLLLKGYGALGSRLAGPRRRAILARHRLDCSRLPPRSVYRVQSINSKETVRLLQALAPDVVVVFHTPIISASVLSKVHAPFINLHGGITPAYRGNCGAYWALVNQDYENVGVTIHLINEGIDTGDVIYQAQTRPTADDNFFSYQFFQTAEGIPLLLRAVDDVLKGSLRTHRPDANHSKLWRTPTLFEYLRNAWQTGVW